MMNGTYDHPPPQSNPPSEDMRKAFNVFTSWSMIHAMPLVAVFRRPGTCGSRFFGGHAFFALFYVPMFCIFTAQPGSRWFPILCFMGIYAVALFRHRWKSLQAKVTAMLVHSRYVGESIVTFLTQCKTEESRRSVAEPIFAIILAMLLLVFGPWAAPVAFYLIVGAICLVVNETIMMRSCEAQTQAMIDVMWDNNLLASNFRNRTGRN